MSEKHSKSPSARLFVALDLPDALRAGLAAWGGEALDDPALRPVPAESLHITLAFLGHRPPDEIEPIATVVRGLSAPRIELGDPVARPERGRPRLFALPAHSPELGRLQATLLERLAGAGLHEAERRPFWPHVTVARVRPRSVPGPLPSLPPGLRDAWLGVRAVFYRSVLQPSGSTYFPLAQVELSRGQQ
ncbi:MAG: 2,3-cyclic 3-phosphodiesterase [Solirubrobacterales bacterium]|nr:2,3-cyclic 3-phosphodiesterase [Solirubrobacterales bacterium]